MEKMIIGLDAAAKFLGCSKRTVCRLIKNGEFPKPASEINCSPQTFREWKVTDLEKYRKNLRPRGNPNLIKQTEGKPK